MERVRMELVHQQPNGVEVSINEQLIALKLADKAEESYLSKVRLINGCVASPLGNKDLLS
jgi:hypothetical protein